MNEKELAAQAAAEAEAQAQAEAATAAEAAKNQPTPEQIAQQEAETARLKEEEHRAWAEANGYAPKPKEEPKPAAQADPNDMFADLAPKLDEAKRARQNFDYDTAARLELEVAEERAYRRATAAMTPYVTGSVLEQTATSIADGLPEEAKAYVKEKLRPLNPAQMQMLQADPAWRSVIRDAAENVARKAQDTAALRTESVASRTTTGLTPSQKEQVEVLKRSMGPVARETLTDQDFEDIVREAD